MEEDGERSGHENSEFHFGHTNVRCHVVILHRQPAAKTGMEGEERDGEAHNGNQQELAPRAVAA